MFGSAASYLVDRAGDQTSHRSQAALQECSGRAADWHVGDFESPEREIRRRQGIAKLVNQEPGTLGLFGLVLGGNVCLALERELGDSIRDGVVQAPIQGSEFIDGERHIPFERQVGDGLAEITVVVDDLIHGVPHLEEFLPVGSGRHPHFGQGQHVAARRPRDTKALGIVIGLLRT